MYVKIKNTGKGFIKSDDRSNFNIISLTLDLWEVVDNAASQAWVTRVNGTILTKEMAEEYINNVNRNIWIQKNDIIKLWMKAAENQTQPATITL